VSWVFGSVNACCGDARTAPESSRIARSIFSLSPSAMPIFEVLISQIGKDREINAVFTKTLRVLGHPELFEPIRYLLRCLHAHDANSSRRALASFRSSVSNPSVNQP
jgi:hypothetical protein